MKPLISIIIPCYNHGKYIQLALDSIDDARGNSNVEIIIVNDGSNDELTISKLRDLELKGYFVLNQNNAGLGNARNSGIKIANGKYILPLDSDNLVLKSYLQDAVEILEKDDNIAIVHTNAKYFGKRLGSWITEDFDFKKILAGNYIDACALYRKSCWEDVGGYNEQMPYQGHEDWEFWIALASKGYKFYHLNQLGFSYFVDNESMIRSFSNEMLEANKNFIKKKYSHLYQKYYEEIFIMYTKREEQLKQDFDSEKFVINLFCSKFFGFKIFKLK